MRFHAIAQVLTFLPLALLTSNPLNAQDHGGVLIPGFIDSLQKISDSEGGFIPPLDDGDVFGTDVAGIGDLDGDGVEDIVVGASADDDGGAVRGAVYVLFLNENGTVDAHQKISDVFGGFTGTLDDIDAFGTSVAAIGDVDGDLVEDIAVGARNDGDGGVSRGAVWVLFLHVNGTVKGHQKISDTEGGFTGTLDNEDNFGESVAGIGDLDGDNVEDIVVGARGDDDGGPIRGAVWVLFLNSDGTVKGHQKISDTEGGFTGTLDDFDNFGLSVAAIGDLDGDNVEDIVVGAPFDNEGVQVGAVWVLFLNADGTVKGHQKISATAGGFTGTLHEFDEFGSSVAGIGDLDGDNVEDIVVGARDDDDVEDDRGAVWILFLNTDGTVKFHQKISSLAGGLDPNLLDESDHFGVSAGGAGDLDNNGVHEIVVGADGDDDEGPGRGAVYVLFVDGTPASLPVELVSFKAVAEGDVAVLSWQTAGEENNAGFEVERRTAAARSPDRASPQWESVGFVEGHGTTAEPKFYTYGVTDMSPGLHRFRLKQVDFDGAFEYSHEVEVLVEVPGGFVIRSAHPNPFRSRATVAFAVGREQVVEVVLYDALGRRVQTLFNGRVTAHQMNTVVVEGQGLTSGVYALHFRSANLSETETLILQE